MAITPLTTPRVDVGNGYELLSRLFDLPRTKHSRILEGEIAVIGGGGIEYILRPLNSKPPVADEKGQPISADNGRGFGPNSPWILECIWVKEATADAGAKVQFSGWVDDGE